MEYDITDHRIDVIYLALCPSNCHILETLAKRLAGRPCLAPFLNNYVYSIVNV